MSTRDKILSIVRREGPIGSSSLVRALRLSRKTVALHLKKLVEEGKLTKTGSTRNAQYGVAQKGTSRANSQVFFTKILRSLEEHQVFTEMDVRLSLQRRLSQKTHGIVEYAFTEMLNNAIDHSQSRFATISARIEKGAFVFQIRDFGIGLFAHIQKKFRFRDEFQAVDHVLKGKQTTQPSKHSGEGLFFTSRIADFFVIRSHRLVLTIDNEKKDFKLSAKRFLKGTEIQFSIKSQSRSDLKRLFDHYSNEEFEFKKGEIRVKISADSGNMSRSQARRICFGLEKFDQIVFDFRGVREIGQAFADEIFRVFAARNPKIDVRFEHANPAVQFMILRAIRS